MFTMSVSRNKSCNWSKERLGGLCISWWLTESGGDIIRATYGIYRGVDFMNTNKSKYMAYLLPIRCVIFAFIFVIGAIITKQKLEDISNWWSIAASIVNFFVILILFFIAP